jgi:hypothetical protein
MHIIAVLVAAILSSSQLQLYFILPSCSSTQAFTAALLPTE